MKRLISLDFFRGMTICLMIIVNCPGSWSTVYPPLLHAEWHGVTPTDLVFPFFLFIVGVSIVLAYSKKKQSGSISGTVYTKILRRSLIIFALGLFLALFPSFDFANLRVVGVLQRIALVFAICSVIYLHTGWKAQLWIGVGCLFGYYLLMCFVPYGDSAAGTLAPGDNLAAWIDQYITPGRMYQKTWDPEGFFSTIPAVGTGITGMLIGAIIIAKKLTNHVKIIWIFSFGLIWFATGYMWDYIFPANKHIWTSSYVLISSGLAAMFLALSMWIIDEQGYKSWTKLGVVFGSNAITAYVLHGVLLRLFQIPVSGDQGIQGLWMSGLQDISMSGQLASFLWAISYMLFIYSIIYVMYRKKIFLKV